MPKTTTNYGLTKPLPEEFYDVAVPNGNMDIIDAKLKELVDQHADDMTSVNAKLKNHDNHITNKNNPHNVTASQIGAQPKNNNLTQYVNGILKTISGTEVKVSSVEIGPDEPDEGDVWIDTDDTDDDSVIPVVSVNGKTGAVNLTAEDVDAYPVGKTYSKEEIGTLLKEYAKTIHSHSTADITGLEEYAKTIHSHSTVDITGLSDYINAFGYGHVESGSHVGTGTAKTVTLSFTPALVISYCSNNNRAEFLFGTGSLGLYMIAAASANSVGSLAQSHTLITMSGSTLTLPKEKSYTYYWIALG